MILQTLNILLVGISTVIPDIRIEHPTFDVGHVRSIRVSTDRITTVSLPVPIRGLEGLFISSEAEAPSKFQISFRPGEQFFSIRALQTNATGNLNIVTSEGVLCLDIQAVTDPVLAVTFVRPNISPADLSPKADPPSVETPEVESVQQNKRRFTTVKSRVASTAVSISRKAVPTDKILPQLIESARSDGRITRRGEGTHLRTRRTQRIGTDNTQDVVVTNIYESDDYDALVFRIELRNPTLVQREYQLDKIIVESGDKTFRVTRVEGEGIIGPRNSGTIYFALVGDGDDAAHLCFSWPFKITVPFIGAQNSTPEE